MIETSACTLAHRTFGYALCYAFCDDRPWKSMEHGALLSCKHRLKHHFNKHLWQIKIKTSDKPRIHKLSIRLPKCKLCAMQRCNCLQFLLSLLQKTRMDLRWYVPEETVRIGRCKAASRRRFFFFFFGGKVVTKWNWNISWWNDDGMIGILFSFFPLRHMFFFASDLCILLMFLLKFCTEFWSRIFPCCIRKPKRWQRKLHFGEGIFACYARVAWLARDSYCYASVTIWHTMTRMMQCRIAMLENLREGIYCHGRVWGATSVVAAGLSQQLRHEATWCLCVACPSAVEWPPRPLQLCPTKRILGAFKTRTRTLHDGCGSFASWLRMRGRMIW